MNFLGPQNSGRIGCKIGIPGAGGENDNTAFLQVPQRTSQDIRFGHLMHGDGRLHAGLQSNLFQRILQGQTVHDRCQHAHVVGRSAFHPEGSCLDAAKNIAATHHDSDLHALVVDGFDLIGHVRKHVRANAEILLAHQGFAAEFQQDTLILWLIQIIRLLPENGRTASR